MGLSWCLIVDGLDDPEGPNVCCWEVDEVHRSGIGCVVLADVGEGGFVPGGLNCSEVQGPLYLGLRGRCAVLNDGKVHVEVGGLWNDLLRHVEIDKWDEGSVGVVTRCRWWGIVASRCRGVSAVCSLVCEN